MSTKLPSISDSQCRPLYLYEVVPVEHIRQAGFQPTKCAPFRAVRAHGYELQCSGEALFSPWTYKAFSHSARDAWLRRKAGLFAMRETARVLSLLPQRTRVWRTLHLNGSDLISPQNGSIQNFAELQFNLVPQGRGEGTPFTPKNLFLVRSVVQPCQNSSRGCHL